MKVILNLDINSRRSRKKRKAELIVMFYIIKN